MRKIFMILLFTFLFCVSPSLVDASYNVKCRYDLRGSKENEMILTTAWVYVDETNWDYKMTYLNTSSEEVELGGFSSMGYDDYKNYDKTNSKLKLANGDEVFEFFDYHYKNNGNDCPEMYVYIEYTIQSYYTYPYYDETKAVDGFEKSQPHKYTSKDGGNTWHSANSTGDISEIRAETAKSAEACGRLGQSFYWDDELLRCIVQGSNLDKAYNAKTPEECGRLGRSYNWDSNLKRCIVNSTTNSNIVKECSYDFLSDFGIGTDDVYKLNVRFEKKIGNEKNPYIYSFYVSGKDYNSGKDFKQKFTNVLGQEIELSDYPLEGTPGLSLYTHLRIFESTIEKILDEQASCIPLYSYNTDDSGGATILVITESQEEADSDTLGDVYDDEGELDSYIDHNDGTIPPNIDISTPANGCEVIPDAVRNWILDTLNLVKYVALVLVIVLGALDFIKAAASGEADQMKKSGSSFLKRVIAVVILFLVPLIVEVVLNLIEIYGADSTCIDLTK